MVQIKVKDFLNWTHKHLREVNLQNVRSSICKYKALEWFVLWSWKILLSNKIHIGSIRPRMVFSLWDCRGLSSFLVHSELWWWPHLCAELDGNGFFLEITSIGNFLVKKSEKNAFRKVPILACFLVKNPGGKKVGIKRRILCVKRILLSFPQFVYVGVLILHEVPQCTPIWPTSTNA